MINVACINKWRKAIASLECDALSRGEIKRYKASMICHSTHRRGGALHLVVSGRAQTGSRGKRHRVKLVRKRAASSNEARLRCRREIRLALRT